MLGMGLSLAQVAVAGRGALAAPTGFTFLTDADGLYLTDADGSYLVEAI